MGGSEKPSSSSRPAWGGVCVGGVGVGTGPLSVVVVIGSDVGGMGGGMGGGACSETPPAG